MLVGMADAEIKCDVEELCSFEARLPGSDAERRAANHLRDRLRDKERRAEIEPTYVHPQWTQIQMLACIGAVLGSVLAGLVPLLGFLLVFAAAVTTYLELGSRTHPLRAMFFRRASQNVISRPREGSSPAPERVILCANYDTARTGAAYNRGPTRLLGAASRRFPVVSAPPRLIFWSMALLLPPLGARLAGVETDLISLLQLPQTMVLILGAFALGEIALSPASPGANDNASGVAAVLAAVGQLDSDPPENLAVDVLLTGAGTTTMAGVRAHLRAHRREIDRERTWLVALEEVGRGELRYLTSEGLAVSSPADPALVDLCEALGSGGGAYAAEPMRHGYASAAAAARARKLRAIAITCREPGQPLPDEHRTPRDTPQGIDAERIGRAANFAVGLVRLLDREVGRRAPQAADGQEPEPAPPATTASA